MLIIKDLTEEIQEELADARNYIEQAFEYKDTDKNLANVYCELANEEMGHAEKLHGQVVRIVKQYREKKGNPPVGMQEIYDWQHKKIMDESAVIKTYIASFRE